MTDGISAVLAFKKLCDEKGINLICINIPYSGFEDRNAGINYAAEIMEEFGITCLDFRKEESELKLNFRTDFFDTHHVKHALVLCNKINNI